MRTCIIAVAALSNRVVDLAAPDSPLGRLARAGRVSIQPTLPAVTCTMQATVTTGAPPGGHGIVANGLCLRELGRVSFWEQSNRLLDAPRFWQRSTARPRTAMLFWQNSMFGAADVVLTPRPIHGPDGRTVSTCYSEPAGLYEQLAAQLGPFDLKTYWGPMASLASSQWIAAAAVRVWQSERPDLQLVYLPHLDYPLQKLGPGHASIAREAASVATLVGHIADAVAADGGRTVVIGDYGITPVRRAALPNVALREAGLLRVRRVAGQELIEVGEQAAFAMVDHQVAHVYCSDSASRRRAAEVLARLDGVAEVIDLARRDPWNLAHARSGELILLAEPDAWFAYYWWTDPAAAPGYARTVDIHRKPGYDPCELFVDMASRTIPLEPALVRGSHGLADVAPADLPVLLTDAPLPLRGPTVAATELAGHLSRLAGLE